MYWTALSDLHQFVQELNSYKTFSNFFTNCEFEWSLGLQPKKLDRTSFILISWLYVKANLTQILQNLLVWELTHNNVTYLSLTYHALSHTPKLLTGKWKHFISVSPLILHLGLFPLFPPSVSTVLLKSEFLWTLSSPNFRKVENFYSERDIVYTYFQDLFHSAST